MIVDLRPRGVRVVLLDIEGTTTPLAFVHDVLFPFARARLAGYLETARDSADLQAVIGALAAEHAVDRTGRDAPPPWRTASLDATLRSIQAYANWLMDRDRKSPGLKHLQGLIWEQGYQAGELRGRVFPDVPPALRRWHARGLAIAIYSSGSELAQRRLFESLEDGDLTTAITAFFDTAVGPKVEAESYRRIAAALRTPPDRIVFVSDVVRELVAARTAGLSALLCIRPGNHPQPDSDAGGTIESFEDLLL